MRNTRRLAAIVPWILLWGASAANPVVLAQQQVVLGELHHEALAEGFPKDRTDVGIGEDVRFWVDSFGEGITAADLQGEICWSLARTDGWDTVYPILGESTTLTVGLSDKNHQLEVQAIYWDPRQEPKAAALPKLDVKVPSATPPPARESNLQQELGKLDRLRTDANPDLQQVEKRGGELLATYFAPEEQALIHFELAEIHAQSGLQQPASVISHARAALRLPLDPSRRARLQVYWGDALRVLDRRYPFTVKRRAATKVYLQALKEVLQLELPARPPKFPVMGFYNIEGADAENKRRMEEQWELRKKLEFQVDMIEHREVLRRQIVSLYQRRPFDRNELEELANRILEDPAEVQRLTEQASE